jgi:hypothetical protein
MSKYVDLFEQWLLKEKDLYVKNAKECGASGRTQDLVCANVIEEVISIYRAYKNKQYDVIKEHDIF